MLFAGRVALVTGASHGIEAATARLLVTVSRKIARTWFPESEQPTTCKSAS